MLPFIESLIEILLLVVKSIFKCRKHAKSEKEKQESTSNTKGEEKGADEASRPHHHHRRASTTETITVTKTTEHVVSGESSSEGTDHSKTETSKSLTKI
jgi:hypothetical protein